MYGAISVEIVDGKRHFEAKLADIARAGHIAQKARRVGIKVPPLTTVSIGVALKARVYRNQWIVDCPDCRNAEFAFIDEPVFMCSYCFNGSVDGKWREVEFPSAKDGIEAVLKARPLPQTRNWRAPETVDKLKAENKANGLSEVG